MQMIGLSHDSFGGNTLLFLSNRLIKVYDYEREW